MPLQHIRPLEGGTAQQTTVWPLRSVRTAMALEMFSSFVCLEAHGTAVERRNVSHVEARSEETAQTSSASRIDRIERYALVMDEQPLAHWPSASEQFHSPESL